MNRKSASIVLLGSFAFYALPLLHQFDSAQSNKRATTHCELFGSGDFVHAFDPYAPPFAPEPVVLKFYSAIIVRFDSDNLMVIE